MTDREGGTDRGRGAVAACSPCRSHNTCCTCRDRATCLGMVVVVLERKVHENREAYTEEEREKRGENIA